MEKKSMGRSRCTFRNAKLLRRFPKSFAKYSHRGVHACTMFSVMPRLHARSFLSFESHDSPRISCDGMQEREERNLAWRQNQKQFRGDGESKAISW